MDKIVWGAIFESDKWILFYYVSKVSNVDPGLNQCLRTGFDKVHKYALCVEDKSDDGNIEHGTK